MRMSTFQFRSTAVLIFFFAPAVVSEDFLSALEHRRTEAVILIGNKKIAAIETQARQKEIYRITQLLEVDGVGELSVRKLGDLLGYRFSYDISIDTCQRKGIC